jgi:hypothetical protein
MWHTVKMSFEFLDAFHARRSLPARPAGDAMKGSAGALRIKARAGMMRSEKRARRLDATVCHILYLGLVVVVLVVGAGLAVTNAHRFHLALTARRLAEKNNAWLAEQCKSPDFYANMREHSRLCDEVALAQADALWLHALRDVFDASRPCGEAACAQLVADGLAWVFQKGVWALCAAGAAALACCWSVLALQRALARAGGGRLVRDDVLVDGRGAGRFYAALGDVDGGFGGFGGGSGGFGGAARLGALDCGPGARRRHPLALGA